MRERLRRTIMFVLLIAGVLTLVLGLSRVNATLRFVREAASAEGQVVTFGPGDAHAVVRFKPSSGDVVDVSRNDLTGGAHGGDTVKLLYLPDNPGATVRLDRMDALWLPGGGIAAIGLVCLLLSGLVARSRPGRGVTRGVSRSIT